jgi:hypothetical protein
VTVEETMKTPWWTAVVIVALLTAVGGWAARASLKEIIAVDAETTPGWARRLGLVDEAIASNNLSRAIYEWREAYGAAWRSPTVEALASVGDAALRIDALGASRTLFRQEARDAYRDSMLLAHARRDVRGLKRGADALAQLGDTTAVERARHMVQAWSHQDAR